MNKQSFGVRVLCLIAVGISPLFLGFLMNWLVQTAPSLFAFPTVLTVLLLLAWGYCSYKLTTPAKNFLLQAFAMCAFGLVMLILAVYQELRMGEYWQNLIGLGSQFFFLPWISLGAKIISIFARDIKIWPMYIVSWVCLFLASGIGCYIKRQK